MCYDISGGIKKARKELNMTQAELAKKLGISKESLSRYETGKSIPGMDVIIKLADYTGRTADEILRLRRYDIETPDIITQLNNQQDNTLSDINIPINPGHISLPTQ